MGKNQNLAGIQSEDGRQFISRMITLGKLPADADANVIMAEAHRARQGRRFAVIPVTPYGVLDCRTGRVYPTPGAHPNALDARDWMLELEYSF